MGGWDVPVEHPGRDSGGVGTEEVLVGFFLLERTPIADRPIPAFFVHCLDALVVVRRDLGRWVGGWVVEKIEEDETVRMRCWSLWVGGWLRR